MAALPVTSYTTRFQVEIAAKPKAVWKAMTRDIRKWWPTHFHSSEKTRAFVMETEVGGRVYEDYGSGEGAEWGKLIVFQPHDKLVWTGSHFGGNGKNWGQFYVTILLEEQGNATVLKFEDSGFGMLDEALPSSLEAGWKELYGTHLKNYLEE